MADKSVIENGFLRWLGRQVGYVAKAVKTDVTAAPESAPDVLYRKDTIEEAAHPADPSLTLRRTIIDEVVKDPKAAKSPLE